MNLRRQVARLIEATRMKPLQESHSAFQSQPPVVFTKTRQRNMKKHRTHHSDSIWGGRLGFTSRQKAVVTNYRSALTAEKTFMLELTFFPWLSPLSYRNPAFCIALLKLTVNNKTGTISHSKFA